MIFRNNSLNDKARSPTLLSEMSDRTSIIISIGSLGLLAIFNDSLTIRLIRFLAVAKRFTFLGTIIVIR